MKMDVVDDDDDDDDDDERDLQKRNLTRNFESRVSRFPRVGVSVSTTTRKQYSRCDKHSSGSYTRESIVSLFRTRK